MKADELSAERARALIEARLGRAPQDALEAAVILEAWGGIDANAAMRLGAELTAEPTNLEPSRATTQPAGIRDGGMLAEALALVMAVVAIAAWTPPLAEEFGNSVVKTALQVALPLTLALQWGLRRRYLGRLDGLGRLAENQAVLGLMAVTILGALSLFLGLSGALAGLLIITWVGGIVVVQRGWAMWYGLSMALVAVYLNLGLPSLGAIAAVAAVTLLTAWFALSSSATAVSYPGSWRGTLAAGLIGGGLGAMLVADSTVGWGTNGALPALALVPSMVASLWAGHHLWDLHEAVPRALQAVGVGEADTISWAGPAMAVFTGAVARLAASACVLSIGAILLGDAIDHTIATWSLLFAFGCIALVMVLISLLESLSCILWALLAVSAGFAVELAVGIWGPVDVAGGGLTLGAATAFAVALPMTIVLLVRPGRLLSTSLWIS